MQKRPSSPTRGSSRVDAILRYRNANEGVLCSARCRELSRTGLTATIERPVFPGDLLRFDLEPPAGGPSVLGLGRVAWTGSDPEGAPGTSIMRMRFISLGEASESTLHAWLDEISAVAQRPSSPHDDSSVRALSRAIADSLLPPPPVLPGALPSEESSGLSPVPIAVPHRPLIPPPPGMYARSAQTLSHPIDYVDPAAHDFGASAAAVHAPDRASAPPRVSRHAGVEGTRGPAALRDSPALRRSAEVRERLSKLQRRRDETPLRVPLRAPRPGEPLPSSPAAARVGLPPPLPLGMLLNAPPETTRRSSPPPPGPVSPPRAEPASSSSWPALRVPPAVAAIAQPDQSPVPERLSRATIPPPASVPQMPALRVSSSFDASDRASLPIDGPSLPLSDAPWSVPAPPARRGALAHRWLALGVGSLALGAALAYVIYGPAFGRHAPAYLDELALGQQGSSAALDRDRSLAVAMALPVDPSDQLLTDPLASGDPFGPTSKQAPPSGGALLSEWLYRGALQKQQPKPATALRSPSPAVHAAPAPQSAAAAPAAAAPAAAAVVGSAAVAAPPPPPALPAELVAPAPPSKLERARACLARGDNDCAAKLLKGATTEPELELWIETLRAQGRAAEARRDMQRFVDSFPDGRRTAAYKRILGNAP